MGQPKLDNNPPFGCKPLETPKISNDLQHSHCNSMDRISVTPASPYCMMSERVKYLDRQSKAIHNDHLDQFQMGNLAAAAVLSLKGKQIYVQKAIENVSVGNIIYSNITPASSWQTSSSPF